MYIVVYRCIYMYVYIDVSRCIYSVVATTVTHLRLQRTRGSTPGAITSPAPVVPVQSSR